ncbi:MAG: hypothetical protein ACOCWJ_05535 [Verrucomicrobiota bacterium]
MTLTVQFCLAAALFTLVGMAVAFSLVRVAADLLIFFIALSACGLVIHMITSGEWHTWAIVSAGSFATGVGAALLCLPALPFSSFFRKRNK